MQIDETTVICQQAFEGVSRLHSLSIGQWEPCNQFEFRYLKKFIVQEFYGRGLNPKNSNERPSKNTSAQQQSYNDSQEEETKGNAVEGIMEAFISLASYGASYLMDYATAPPKEEASYAPSLQLDQVGHGVVYLTLKKGEDIKEIEVILKSWDKQNQLEFSIDLEKTTLKGKTIDLSWSSQGQFPNNDAMRQMSHFNYNGDTLACNSKYWISISAVNGFVSCGFGEIHNVTTFFEATIPEHLRENLDLQKVEYRGKDHLGNALLHKPYRVEPWHLAKGGVLIMPKGQIGGPTSKQIHKADLPYPVQELREEMIDEIISIEKKYGEQIWDVILDSLDHGLLYEFVQSKRRDALAEGSPINANQVYIRVAFGQEAETGHHGPGHRMVLELWPAGHSSPIHEHSASYSYIKILKGGKLVNENYPIMSECAIGAYCIARGELTEGDETWISPHQNQIHKIENNSQRGVISFHGYKYGDKGQQNLTGGFDLIDKKGDLKKGAVPISHWDSFYKEYGLHEMGIEKGLFGFFQAITTNSWLPLRLFLNQRVNKEGRLS